MKVFAISSSPRKDKGNTSLILTPFLEAMKEAGADVELFYTADLKMKTLMDRMVPQIKPTLEIVDGHTRHPLQDDVKKSKIVLASNCGLWEKDNFDPMLAHMKAFCRNAHAEFAGALLRPHGEALGYMLRSGIGGQEARKIVDACREAGRQMAKDGKMSAEVLDAVSRDLVPRDMYVQIVNQYFQDSAKK